MIVKSLDQLNTVAKKISKFISNGDVILLNGELGTGKTTFAGLLINDIQLKNKKKITNITSPTFNILHEYKFKKFIIHHYDFYRLKSEKELINLGVYEDKKIIKIIEWPDFYKEKIINGAKIKFHHRKEPNERSISFIFFGKWKKIKINAI